MQVSKILRRCVDSKGGDLPSLVFWCPGCEMAHSVAVAPHPAAWGWNGDVDKPTFTPSYKATWPRAQGDHVCHSFVTDGRIQFLGDCTHALAGQTVDIPAWPWPDWGGTIPASTGTQRKRVTSNAVLWPRPVPVSDAPATPGLHRGLMRKALDQDVWAGHGCNAGDFELVTQPDGQRFFWFCCPGKCKSVTALAIRPVDPKYHDRASWELTGTEERPTLRPSIHHPGCWHGWLTDGVAASC